MSPERFNPYSCYPRKGWRLIGMKFYPDDTRKVAWIREIKTPKSRIVEHLNFHDLHDRTVKGRPAPESNVENFIETTLQVPILVMFKAHEAIDLLDGTIFKDRFARANSQLMIVEYYGCCIVNAEAVCDAVGIPFDADQTIHTGIFVPEVV